MKNISNTFTVNILEKGESPYLVDINNEMDSVTCKANGDVQSIQVIEAVVRMFYGTTEVAIDVDTITRNGVTMTWDGNNNGVFPSWSGSAKTLRIEYTASPTQANIADKDEFVLTVHSRADQSVSRTVTLTVNGVRSNTIYQVLPSYSIIVKKSDGTYIPSTPITCGVVKIENGVRSVASSSEYTLEKSIDGGSYTDYAPVSPSLVTSKLTFRLTVNGSVADSETIPVVSDGEQGDKGDVGRFYYYAGAWSDFSSTDTFEVTDVQAPYFQYGGTSAVPNYWVFNPKQNNTYTKSQMGTPSSSSSNWTQMTNDFKYIITEAIFGKYAHLGSFIINGDFFISQYGTLFYNNSGTIVEYEASAWDGNHSTKAYTYFKTSDPMVNEMPSRGSYKFRPAKCIDAKTGEEWMARGNMHVSSSGDVSVKGTIQALNLYRSVALVSRMGVDPVNQTRVSVMDGEGGYSVWLYFKLSVTVGTVVFEAQTYHRKSEYDSLSPEYSVDDLIGQGKVRLCTYAADEVFVTYNNQNTSSGIVTVPLPRCQDFVGKIVTVRNDISSYVVNPFNVTVVQCDDSDFAFASVFLSMNGYDISGGNSQNHVDVDSGDTAIFYATTTRWERLK